MLSTIPFWTDARKFCGMAPPKILSSHTKPSPRFVGATSITQIPYWPWPPDCLTCRPSARLWPETVSRYATRGTCVVASTPYLRLSFSRVTSRCTSPRPAMTSCLVSSTRSTCNVGSSSLRRARPPPRSSSPPPPPPLAVLPSPSPPHTTQTQTPQPHTPP